MAFEIWLTFVVAAVAILASPGPTIMMVCGFALGGGRRTALGSVPGVALGDLLAMTLSLAGVGALLATSATLFALVKLAGALWLIWLGVKLWRQGGAGFRARRREPVGLRSVFGQCFAVTALNPKSILFFTAFVPQFVSAELPFAPQAVILIVTFVTLAALNALIWAVAAGSLARRMGPKAEARMNRLGGGVMIGAGVLAASSLRNA